MSWARKYRSLKDKLSLEADRKEVSSDVLFNQFQEKLKELYQEFNGMIDGTMIQTKYHKHLISKEQRSALFGEKERVDALILSDNDNELKIIPEGIHFIGVLGRVVVRAYRKVYTFNSIIERRLKLFKEPHFFLVHDQEKDNEVTWGYIEGEESSLFGKEVKKLTPSIIEKLLDEVFLSSNEQNDSK